MNQYRPSSSRMNSSVTSPQQFDAMATVLPQSPEFGVVNRDDARTRTEIAVRGLAFDGCAFLQNVAVAGGRCIADDFPSDVLLKEDVGELAAEACDNSGRDFVAIPGEANLGTTRTHSQLHHER